MWGLSGVAPRAGAWIETGWTSLEAQHRRVAPRAGAWIETQPGIEIRAVDPVAPRAGAWIETRSAILTLAARRSRPVRARGLKHRAVGGEVMYAVVAPRAGAWVETPYPALTVTHAPRRAPCGRVD